MTQEESKRMIKDMRSKGYLDNHAWPSRTFATIYLAYGKNDEVKRYSQIAMQLATIEEAFKRASTP